MRERPLPLRLSYDGRVLRNEEQQQGKDREVFQSGVELFGLECAEADAEIGRNLDDLKWSLLNLRSDYQNRLIEADDDTVFALTGDFVYMTNDMGLYVDGYFIKQDIRWTDDDLAMLTRHLKDRDVHVVIHRWVPSDEIQAAVAAANAEIVVLQSGDPGIVVDDALARDGLQQILKNNLYATIKLCFYVLFFLNHRENAKVFFKNYEYN